MRLIDADALIEQMEAEAEHIEDSICKLVVETDIREVKYAPTIDAVQVVRCKDCEHWVPHFKGCVVNPCVNKWNADAFCSNGSRRIE